MKEKYNILPESLHVTADAAISWFVKHWGVTRSNFKVEKEIEADIGFRPTLVAKTRDGHLLCVEVSETIYKNALDSFVLDCQRTGRPIKLVVAVPKSIVDPDYAKKLKQARRAGVGILEVGGGSGELTETPLSLSLSSVRPVKVERFPKEYREALVSAENVFRKGEPPKACGMVYDELEASFRRFAKKCEAMGAWVRPAKMNIDTVAWAALVKSVQNGLDRKKHKAVKPVTDALLARIHGVTSHRNDTGHKPSTEDALRTRDEALRTRFETVVDLFQEFIDATRPLKI